MVPELIYGQEGKNVGWDIQGGFYPGSPEFNSHDIAR